MISALKDYSETEPPTPDAAMVMKTAEYLEACNLIFERGILSKKIIRSMESPVIHNIKKGFQFFTDWYKKHQRTGNLMQHYLLFSLSIHSFAHSGLDKIYGNILIIASIQRPLCMNYFGFKILKYSHAMYMYLSTVPQNTQLQSVKPIIIKGTAPM